MRIAITGGIAEGKSTVLGLLRDMGFSAASSDEAARELFMEPEVNARLAELAGTANGITPSEMRDAILASPEIRRGVNRFLHPLIGERMRRLGATFVEVPLLVEACLQREYDEVWVVTCGVREQRRRLTQRYGNPGLVNRLLSVQVPSAVRIAFADLILRTNRPVDYVHSSLRKATRDRLG